MMLCRMAGKSSPAAANLQHMVSRLELQFLTQRLIFRILRIRQRLPRMLETRGRVSHRLIKPERVELIPKVIVLGDVAPAGAHTVGPQQMLHAIDKVQQIHTGHLAGGTARSLSLGEIQNEPLDHRRDVVSLPVTIDIGLAKSHIAEQGAALEKIAAANAHLGRDGRAMLPHHMRTTIGVHHSKPPVNEGLERQHEKPLIKSRLRRRRCGDGDVGVAGDGVVHGL